MDKQFSEMTGSELVEAFNAMLETKEGKQLIENNPTAPRLRTVNKFSDRESGVKRCELLASSIRALKPQKEEPAPKKKKGERKAGMRMGAPTNRSKLKNFLLENLGQEVSLTNICVALYGKGDQAFRGPANMVLKGLQDVDIGKNFPYKLEKRKDDELKEIFYKLSQAG